MKKPVRVGVYGTVEGAELAIDRLLQADVPKEEISVVCPEDACRALRPDIQREEPAGERTAESVTAGGSLGALLGLGTAATLATGGAGLVVAGPLIGGAAAGAVSGGFVGAMLTRGFEPEIADYYDQALQKGKVLVAVEADDEARLEETEAILASTGAEPVSLPSG